MAYFVKFNSGRWPDAIVSYMIDARFPFKEQILSAMRKIEDNTKIRFQEISARAGSVTDYVVFVSSNRNFSYPGKRIGVQYVELIPDNSKGELAGIALHEIGHVIGLFHEHQRADRDPHVKINDNVIVLKQSEFSKIPLSVAARIEPYDYESISHYASNAYSTNPSQKSIEIVNPAEFHFYSLMGQRDHLSAGDLNAIKVMYGA